MARARKMRRRGCKRCIVGLNKDVFGDRIDRIGDSETEEGLAILEGKGAMSEKEKT